MAMLKRADVTLGRRAVLAGGAGLIAGSALSLPAAARGYKAGRETRLFKCTEFIKRAPGLSQAQFVDHWLKVRAPLMRRLPGLQKATLNAVDPQLSPDALYDGVIQLWFKDAAAYRRAFNGAAPEVISALAEDAPRFMRPDLMGMFNREVIIRDLAPGTPKPQAKRIGLIGRKPDMSQEEFYRVWVDEHAGEVDRQFGLQRYVLNLMDRERFPDSPYDGYAELWWTDWPTQRESSRRLRAEYQATRASFFHSHLLLLVSEVD